MDWFRAHHGISTDIKLAIVAGRLEVPRCEVGWVWMICLDHASQNTEDRGNIGNLQNDEIAMLAGISVERVAAILDGLRERKMLRKDGRLTNWDKRQPLRERDDNSADRVRRLREKRHVTPCNANDNHVTPRTEQNRTDTEQSRTDTHNAKLACVPPKPKASDLCGVVSNRFEEFWERYPRKQRKDFACSEWVSKVTTENEAEVFACLDRYMESDEVARSVVANPDKWLYEQHRNQWAGTWPKARDSPQVVRTKQQLQSDAWSNA